jgi:hypothetical protein
MRPHWVRLARPTCSPALSLGAQVCKMILKIDDVIKPSEM